MLKFEINEEPSFTSVIFYRNTENDNEKKLPNSAEKQIVYFLSNKEKINTQNVEDILNVKERRAREILNNMAKKRLLEKIGKTKGSYYILNKDEK